MSSSHQRVASVTRHARPYPRLGRPGSGPQCSCSSQELIAVAGAKTACIERGSPWENGYIESFNARLRIELLNGEIFYTLREAQIIIESPARHFKGCTYMLVGG
jgi:putative transposase